MPAGYNFDYRQRRRAREAAVGRGRAARHAQRHALPRARARSEQPAHVAAGVAQDPGPGLRRRRRGRTEAAVDAQPERRPGGVPATGRRALGERDRGRRSPDGEGDASRPTAALGTSSRAWACRPTSSTRSRRRTPTLLAVHRTLADGDLYFVNNRSDRAEDVEATFRVSGKQAELWHADTGAREPASFRVADGRTTVPLHLEPWGAVFVVFRKPATSSARLLPGSTEKTLATLEGAWDVRFQPGRGAPDRATARPARVVERERRRRREVLLRHGHLHARRSRPRPAGSRQGRSSGSTSATSRTWPRSP